MKGIEIIEENYYFYKNTVWELTFKDLTKELSLYCLSPILFLTILNWHRSVSSSAGAA